MSGRLHLTPEELGEFDALEYRNEELGFSEHRNVVVLRSGICLKNGLILKDSIHAHPHLYRRFAVNAYGSWLKRRAVPLDADRRFIVIHNIWSGGYYHWITESLARLQPVEGLLDRATVLLPSHTSITDVMVESLGCFGVKQTEFFPPERNVRTPNLVLPQNPLRHTEVSQASVDFVRRRVLKNILPDGPRAAPGRKIFISRAMSRARKIANEAEVAGFLEARGYQRVFMEKLSFPEEVRLMQEAEVVVAQHGAGLTNILFMRPGAKVLELFRRGEGKSNWGRGLNSAKLNPAYPRLAARVGLNYFCLLCDASSAQQSFDIGDIVVDVDRLEEKLQALEACGSRQS